MTERLILTILDSGYQASINNEKDANGFKIRINKAYVVDTANKEHGPFDVTGKNIGSQQITLRTKIVETGTANYGFKTLKLFDEYSGTIFGTLSRENGAVIDYVNSAKFSVVLANIIIGNLPDKTVTIIENTKIDANLGGALDAHIASTNAHPWSAITEKPFIPTVINNLTTKDSKNAVSAEMGKKLADEKADKTAVYAKTETYTKVETDSKINSIGPVIPNNTDLKAYSYKPKETYTLAGTYTNAPNSIMTAQLRVEVRAYGATPALWFELIDSIGRRYSSFCTYTDNKDGTYTPSSDIIWKPYISREALASAGLMIANTTDNTLGITSISPLMSDLDSTDVLNGEFRFSGTSTTSEYPAEFLISAGVIDVHRFSGGWLIQDAMVRGDSKDFKGRHYTRCTYMENNVIKWTDWRKFAFIDDNVASATKLQTARTIGGVPFDGLKDVYFPISINYIATQRYAPGDLVKVDGVWYECYHPDGCLGKDPRDAKNRPSGWTNTDESQPYYWIELGKWLSFPEVGSPIYLPSTTLREGLIKYRNDSKLHKSKFWRIASLYPNLISGNYITIADLRAEFLRGLDDDRGIDKNRKINTFQDFQVLDHSHGIQSWTGKNETLVDKYSNPVNNYVGIATTNGDGGVYYSDRQGLKVPNINIKSAPTTEIMDKNNVGSNSYPRNIAMLAATRI